MRGRGWDELRADYLQRWFTMAAAPAAFRVRPTVAGVQHYQAQLTLRTGMGDQPSKLEAEVKASGRQVFAMTVGNATESSHGHHSTD
jgi:hypothetical protein